jgi:hypothetical protein
VFLVSGAVAVHGRAHIQLGAVGVSERQVEGRAGAVRCHFDRGDEGAGQALQPGRVGDAGTAQAVLAEGKAPRLLGAVAMPFYHEEPDAIGKRPGCRAQTLEHAGPGRTG